MSDNSVQSNPVLDIVDVPRPKRLTDALDAYFAGVVLPKYVGKSINAETVEAMRVEIIDRLRKITTKATFRTHDDLVVWLGNEYFMAIEINGMRLGQLTGPVAAPIGDVPSADLRLYRDIYRETDIGDKLATELHRRGAS